MLSPAHNTQLDIVDEADTVIGRASRAEVHAQGLLHREVHVWFVTPDLKVIFQKRAPDKDTFPGLLDATVGGHVELGQTYEEAALREMEEESGLLADAEDIVLLGMYRGKAVDAATGNTNNVHRAVYGYRYDGRVEDLAIEADAGAGFESLDLSELTETSIHSGKLIPSLLEAAYLDLYRKLEKLVSNASQTI